MGDGFLINTIRVMCHSWLILTPMALLKQFMKIPDEVEMKFHLNFVMICFFQPEHKIISRPHEEIKKQLKYSFTQIIKNSVAYSISSWLACLALYPLSTVQSRLNFQESKDAVCSYSSTLDAFRSIYRQEGISGFYNGLGVRAFMIIPELGMWVVVYGIGRLCIRFLFVE